MKHEYIVKTFSEQLNEAKKTNLNPFLIFIETCIDIANKYPNQALNDDSNSIIKHFENEQIKIIYNPKTIDLDIFIYYEYNGENKTTHAICIKDDTIMKGFSQWVIKSQYVHDLKHELFTKKLESNLKNVNTKSSFKKI